MKTGHLSQRLKADHRYHSPPRILSLLERIPGWGTILYYTQLIFLISGSARSVRKGEFDDRLWCRNAQRVIQFVEVVGGRVEVDGLGNFGGRKGPFVFIANHMSMLDTFLLPAVILPFHRVTFVVKEALLKYPVFGVIMRAVAPIAVKRINPREDLKQVLSEGVEILKQNRSIVIFPQATRNSAFNPSQFNSLGVKLARKAGVPVVPVALKTDFQQNGRVIKEFGPIRVTRTVHIQFGEPLPIEGSGQETHQQVVSFIEDQLVRWGGEIHQPTSEMTAEG